MSSQSRAILLTTFGAIIAIALFTLLWTRVSRPIARYRLALKWTDKLNGPIYSLSVAHLGQFVAAGGEQLMIYDVATRTEWEWPRAAHILAFSSDDTALIACDLKTNTITKIHVASRSVAASMTLSCAAVMSIAMRDGDQVGAYVLDASGKIWYVNFLHNSETLLLDPMTALEMSQDEAMKTAVKQFAVRRDGNIVCCVENHLCHFDGETGLLLWKSEIGDFQMNCLGLRDDDTRIAIVSRNPFPSRSRPPVFWEFTIVDASNGDVLSSMPIAHFGVVFGSSSPFVFEFKGGVELRSAFVAIRDVGGGPQPFTAVGRNFADPKSCSRDGTILATFHPPNDLYVFQIERTGNEAWGQRRP